MILFYPVNLIQLIFTVLVLAVPEAKTDSIILSKTEADTVPLSIAESDSGSFFANVMEVSINELSKEKKEPERLPMTDLISILMEEEEEITAKGIERLLPMISEICDEEKDEERATIDVLSFLERVYSEHSFTETGSWEVPKGEFRYFPFTGELPSFTKNDFRQPIEGKITSRFGFRPEYGRTHHGTDYLLNAGDTVCCALPGVVTGIGYDPKGYGNYVVVSHAGDLQTLYGHLQAVIRELGEELRAGDPLGIGGSTGNSTGPHLHFETRFKGRAVDYNFSR